MSNVLWTTERGNREINISASAKCQKTLDDLDQATRARMSAQNHHESNIKKCQAEINGYKRQGSNKVQLFGGNNVPVLLQAIERAKKSFKTMPLGPLGQV